MPCNSILFASQHCRAQSQLHSVFAVCAQRHSSRIPFVRCIGCGALRKQLGLDGGGGADGGSDAVFVAQRFNGGDSGTATHVRFTGAARTVALETFINRNLIPAVVENATDFVGELVANELPVLKLFSNVGRGEAHAKQTQFYLTRLRAAVAARHGQMVAVYHSNDALNRTELEELGVDAARLPAVFIHDVANGRVKYAYVPDAAGSAGAASASDGGVSTAGLQRFVDAFFAGSLRPHVRSMAPQIRDPFASFKAASGVNAQQQQQQQQQQSADVSFVVGLDFERDVLSATSDAVVLFCWPELPACRQATRLLEQTAAYLRPHNGAQLRFLTFDPTRNDHPPEAGFAYPELVGGTIFFACIHSPIHFNSK